MFELFVCIGETKRILSLRIKEHKRALDNDPLISAVATHAFNYNQSLTWEPIIIF